MAKRDPFEPRVVASRRGGRVKQPLSRDLIVTTALELLTRDGPEGMSLRRVAAALDTGPASLYVYVQDLQELEALVLDRALGDVKTTWRAQRPWRERLEALLESYLRVLSNSPGLARLGMKTIAAGPNALRMIEALLGILDEAGVDRSTAAWAVDLLMLYVTAIAVERGHRRDQADPIGTIARVIGAVSPEDHPRIHQVREQLLSGGPARFDWAVQVLLEGILKTPVDEAGKGRRPPRSR